MLSARTQQLGAREAMTQCGFQFGKTASTCASIRCVDKLFRATSRTGASGPEEAPHLIIRLSAFLRQFFARDYWGFSLPFGHAASGLFRLRLDRCGPCRGRGCVVAGILVATVAFDGIGRFDAALGSQPGILLPVARLQTSWYSVRASSALAVQVQHAAQVNVRPGNQSAGSCWRASVFWNSSTA